MNPPSTINSSKTKTAEKSTKRYNLTENRTGFNNLQMKSEDSDKSDLHILRLLHILCLLQDSAIESTNPCLQNLVFITTLYISLTGENRKPVMTRGRIKNTFQ